MTYKVHLDVFDGPLDLLLFFIQRDEIDIYDIPISRITDSYLGYLDLMRRMNISVAGEYLRMAATLMRIKARTLLPQLADSEDEEEIEDPRSELVQMLLEYKRFKEVSTDLREREAEYSSYFARQPDLSKVDTDVSADEALSDVTLYELMKTFQQLITNIQEPPIHRVQRYDVTIQEQAEYLRQKLEDKDEFRFSEVMAEIENKLVLIMTFVAILDLIKSQQIFVSQSEAFDDFHIKRRAEEVEL
jgi:segregation and condensation protein A